MDKVALMAVFVAVSAAVMHGAAAQTVHVVGDGTGWAIPPNPSFYSNWASGKTFVEGDILVFNFATNQHNVLQVPQASYDACTQDNAIGGIITTGPANVTLRPAGGYNFICTVGRHCQSGQKLAITVVSSTPGGANPPTTAPPSTPTTPSVPTSPKPDANAPTGETPGATRPPPDSASTSLAASFLVASLSAAVAWVF